MNLKKAIELGELVAKGCSLPDCYKEQDAIKLLIEAGKRLDLTRRGRIIDWHILLPGETED